MFCIQHIDSSDCTTGHITVMPNPSYMGVHKVTVWNVLVFKPSSFNPWLTRLVFNFVQCFSAFLSHSCSDVWSCSQRLCSLHANCHSLIMSHDVALFNVCTDCITEFTFTLTCQTLQCCELSAVCVCLLINLPLRWYLHTIHTYYVSSKRCVVAMDTRLGARSLGGTYGLAVWICISLQW